MVSAHFVSEFIVSFKFRIERMSGIVKYKNAFLNLTLILKIKSKFVIVFELVIRKKAVCLKKLARKV